MSEKLHLQLDEAGDWFLGADSLQWMILRRRPIKDKDDQFIAQSFIAHSKSTILRVATGDGIVLTDEARETIDSWPDTFLEYAKIHAPKSGKGRKKTVDN